MSTAVVQFLNTLTRIRDVLTDVEGSCPLEPQPCRIGTYPGGEVPLDACGDTCTGAEGMLWVNLQPITSPNAGVDPSCQRVIITGEIGITRCSAQMDARGNPPSVGAVEANAVQQALDADRVANAVVCCPDLSREERERLTLVSWRPIDNQGGCYGGIWTVSGTYDICC